MRVINSMVNLIDRPFGEWELIADSIMFALVNRNEPVSADDFYSLAVKESMPPSLIKKYAGGKFRQYQAAGYLRKRADYKLSERNGGATLPLWERA